MKLAFAIVAFLLLNGVSFSQSEDCLMQLRTGKFKYVGVDTDAIISRTKKIQRETWDGGRSMIVMKIKWLDDRTYRLKVKKVINGGEAMSKGDLIITKITACDGKVISFVYTSKYGKGDAKMRKIN